MLTRHHRDKFWLCLSLIFCAAFFLATPTWSQEGPQGSLPLQLEVSINGEARNLIAAFFDLGNGRMASTAQELEEIGIKPPSNAKPQDIVELDRIGGLTYAYDERRQSIDITTTDEHRVAESIYIGERPQRLEIAPSDYGAVLNYSLYGGYGGEGLITPYSGRETSGVNATLDGRVFSPYGVLSQTAILGMTLANETSALRLDTTYTYVDPDAVTEFRAGDVYTGGTAWTRRVRMGGVQFRSSFGSRPDIVKNPVPVLSGSAVVPTSVDIFVNGIKATSKDVGAGPFMIENASSISGSGVAQIVTRDASGRRTVQEVSFYNSSQLLKPGLSDFSVEAGVSRGYYGVLSNEYDDAPFVSGTLRRGISDWLTLEGHSEVSEELLNGGGGFVAKVMDHGVISGAVSGSLTDNGAGYQLYGSFETKLGPALIRGWTQRSFEDYDDLASLTARTHHDSAERLFGNASFSSSLFRFEPPTAIDSLTLSMPIKTDRSTIGATYLRYEYADDSASQIIAAHYSRPLVGTANLRATGFVDLDDTDNAGFFVGVSMSLDGDISASAGVNGIGKELGTYASASKSVDQEPGSWGWRVNDLEGYQTRREATVGYRGEAARVEAGLTQYGSEAPRATGLVEGAVSYMGGSVFASNRIDDSFAVVDAHHPDVKIKRDNTVVAITGADGKALVPRVNSYQKNKISIDEMDLPLNAEPASTNQYVTPQFRSGVYVDFDVKLAPASAIVILQLPNGRVVPVGSEAKLDGSDEEIVVGYDGQTYVRGLKAVNTLHVSMSNGTCTAHFTYQGSGEAQETIGPEICQ